MSEDEFELYEVASEVLDTMVIKYIQLGAFALIFILLLSLCIQIVGVLT